MPEIPTSDVKPSARATAGQLRRAGFVIEPADTANDATTGFETLSHHADEMAGAEIQVARKRGDAAPSRGKPT